MAMLSWLWLPFCTASLQNPSGVQFERSMARMSPEPGATCTWGQFCHVWKDAISAEEHSRAMLEKAFPVWIPCAYLPNDHLPCGNCSTVIVGV